MTAHRLILIRDDDRPSDSAAVQVQSILCRVPACGDLRIEHLTMTQAMADPDVFHDQAVAWILVDQADAGRLFEVIGLLQEHHLPVMLTRAGETQPVGALHQDGVVVCPPGSPPVVVGAVLQSLRSQLPVLQAIGGELKLLRVHQGGLCDQIGRIDEELRLAAQLQREFLPKKLASIGDVAFRVLFRPAGYVSGDIYDVVRLDERRLGFFIADAVGHGVPAALLTMFIKRSLVTKKIDPAAERGYRLTQPAEALDKLNRDLVESQGGQVRFATACYGVIDCETREVCVARAGHPFPILLRASGETETLEPEGGLLGVFPEEVYQQVCFRVNPGDRLLLYSDGFEMAFPGPAARHGRVASTRYEAEFEDLRVGSLDDALRRLHEKLDGQVGSLNQRDDLTMLCMGVEAAAEDRAKRDALAMSAA